MEEPLGNSTIINQRATGELRAGSGRNSSTLSVEVAHLIVVVVVEGDACAVCRAIACALLERGYSGITRLEPAKSFVNVAVLLDQVSVEALLS